MLINGIGGMLITSFIVGLIFSLGYIALGYGEYALWNKFRRGQVIERAIFPYYEAVGFKANRWIARSDNPPMDRRRPDLRHHGPGFYAGQVYEIKSEKGVAEGIIQLNGYIGVLNVRYPNITWHPGNVLLCPQILPKTALPFNYIRIHVRLAAPGVIAYEPYPDYGEAAKVGVTAFALTFLILFLKGVIPKLPPMPLPVPQPA